MKPFNLLALIYTFVMSACSAGASNPNVKVVSPAEFQTKLAETPDAYLLDVRKPDEYAAGHLNGAHLLNWLDTAGFKKGMASLDKSKTIFVYCRSGRRSNEAADMLAENGYKVIDLKGGILAWEKAGLTTTTADDSQNAGEFERQGIAHDTFTTDSGKSVKIHFIKHASLILDVDGYLIYIDPTAMFGHDFSSLPKADAIMVTHEHHDHYDPKAIESLTKASTRLICNGRVAELYGKGKTMAPGDSIEVNGINIAAVPAYNITADHLQFHPKERKDVGYVYDIDGLRIYVAGDTEDIPEPASLKDIDIAFIPVNQPYTMTPEQAIHAIKTVSPKIAYPYHFGQTDLTEIEDNFKEGNIEIRVRELQ